MLDYLFVVCQYVTTDNQPVMKKVEVVKKVLVCSDHILRNNCTDGFQVVFSGEKFVSNVRETSCLYITNDNKKDIKYEE